MISDSPILKFPFFWGLSEIGSYSVDITLLRPVGDIKACILVELENHRDLCSTRIFDSESTIKFKGKGLYGNL